MLKEEQIAEQAIAATLNSDFGEDFTAGYCEGATWANEQNAAEIAVKDAAVAQLIKTLRNTIKLLKMVSNDTMETL